MTSQMRPAAVRITGLLLASALIAACSSGPQSQVTESEGPSAGRASVEPASGAPASAAPSESPASAEPASEAPSEAVATPAPTAQATPLAIPPKPAKVTWKRIGSEALPGGETRESFRLGWTAPEGIATTFTVHGVTACLRDAKKYDGKPCVVKGMKIPRSALKLIAQVPGSTRTVDIAWKVGEIGPGPYSAVLIRASNGAGDSIFTIAWSADVCWKCTY